MCQCQCQCVSVSVSVSMADCWLSKLELAQMEARSENIKILCLKGSKIVYTCTQDSVLLKIIYVSVPNLPLAPQYFRIQNMCISGLKSDGSKEGIQSSYLKP